MQKNNHFSSPSKVENKFNSTSGSAGGFYDAGSSSGNNDGTAVMSKTATGHDRKKKKASPPHMMPSIIPTVDGDNVTHSTHTHRSDEGALTPNYVNRYSIGKGAKKVKSKTRLHTKSPRNQNNNNDLQRLSSGVIGIQAVTANGS